jgi:hypothetical protein
MGETRGKWLTPFRNCGKMSSDEMSLERTGNLGRLVCGVESLPLGAPVLELIFEVADEDSRSSVNKRLYNSSWRISQEALWQRQKSQ